MKIVLELEDSNKITIICKREEFTFENFERDMIKSITFYVDEKQDLE